MAIPPITMTTAVTIITMSVPTAAVVTTTAVRVTVSAAPEGMPRSAMATAIMVVASLCSGGGEPDRQKNRQDEQEELASDVLLQIIRLHVS